MNMQEHDEIYRLMVESDEQAKAAGQLVGRYVRESIADGYAYYAVTKVDGKMAKVSHVKYLDGYRVPMIESMDGEIPVKYVTENIAMRDRWAAMFEKRES